MYRFRGNGLPPCEDQFWVALDWHDALAKPSWTPASTTIGGSFWNWWALCNHHDRKSGRTILCYAFTASQPLSASCIVSDEVLIAYAVEVTERLFIAFLLTLLTIELLPENAADQPRRSLP